jgi:endonuclease/exonuclease/phosphatase family metal-dependent hydrolase
METERAAGWRRGLAWGLGVPLVAFVLYRALAVYTFTIGTCVPPSGGSPVAAIGQRRPVRVLSYNIEGHAALLRPGHLGEVAQVIVASEADIVGLQEVHRGTWQSRFRDQAAELARLTGMSVYYGTSFRAMGGEFGNAVLTRGRILDADVGRLPSFGEPRSVLRATIEVGGLRMRFLVTHLAAWGPVNRRVRTEQAACLSEQLVALGEPFVLVGDLNAGPGAPELVTLLGGDRLQLCGLAADATHPLTRQRIDYILADAGWRVREARVIREGPSDHWPVAALLERGAGVEAGQ